jgi:sec-independent protein translocase protein TatC
MAFKYLLTFGSEVDKPMITIAEYLSFFTVITLVFGMAFEMPLVLILLGMLGVLDHHTLKTKRRVAIMVLAILSAVVTPPDAISMLSLLAPLMVLYEFSIWAVYFIEKKRPVTV